MNPDEPEHIVNELVIRVGAVRPRERRRLRRARRVLIGLVVANTLLAAVNIALQKWVVGAVNLSMAGWMYWIATQASGQLAGYPAQLPDEADIAQAVLGSIVCAAITGREVRDLNALIPQLENQATGLLTHIYKRVNARG